MGKNIFFSTRLRHFWHVSYPNMSLSAILNGFSGDTVLASPGVLQCLWHFVVLSLPVS